MGATAGKGGGGQAPSTLTYVATFKYDLGGRITNHRRLLEKSRTGRDGDSASRNDFDLSVFNFSYVATRDLPSLYQEDVLVTGPTPLAAILPGVNGSAQSVEEVLRRVWVYPQGVVSIDYIFTFDRPSYAAVLDLMKVLPGEKNKDYVAYLREHLPPDLYARIEAVLPTVETTDRGFFENHPVIEDVMEALADIMEERPYRYVFHDYRQVVSARLPEGCADTEIRAFLRDVALMEYRGSQDGGCERVQMPGVDVMISRWCCSALIEQDATPGAEETLAVFFNHVHRNWYLCQLWIFAIDDYMQRMKSFEVVSESRPASLAEMRRTIELYQTTLEFDLAEIFDVDLVVKEYTFTRLLTSLLSALNLHSHYDLLRKRAVELDRYYGVVLAAINERLERQREKQALIIENVFAALAMFSITSVLFDIAQSSLLTNLVIVGLIVVLYGLYLYFRMRDFSRRGS